MTNAELWAFIAFLALAGWSAVLIYVSKQILPMANAFNTQHKIVKYQDDLVWSMIKRAQDIQEKKSNPTAPKKEIKSRNPLDTLAGLFDGESPLEPVMDQPDAEGIEIVE